MSKEKLPLGVKDSVRDGKRRSLYAHPPFCFSKCHPHDMSNQDLGMSRNYLTINTETSMTTTTRKIVIDAVVSMLGTLLFVFSLAMVLS